MPTDLAQFAAHMDTMSKSIITAQKELRVCLDALQSPPTSPEDAEPVADGCDREELTQQVMNAYARLRIELGTALRECERGRSPLTATLQVNALPESIVEEDTELGPVHTPGPAPPSPALSHSSLGLNTELEIEVDTSTPPQLNLDVFDQFIYSRRVENSIATPSQPSLGGSSKNPFAHPDPEQVYEATIPPVTMQLREKSKLSRAERIRQMRERRAAGGATVLSDIPGSSSDERASEKNGKSGRGQMGPGGDVVQELRSVINLVSERRRGQGTSAGSSTNGSSSLATSSPLSRSHSVSGASPVIPEAQLLPPAPIFPTSSSPSSRDRDEQENEPPVRSRTSSTGTTRAPKPPRQPPPLPMDGFDTDTFGPREVHSSSPSLPSSPSPPASPLARSFELAPSVYTSAPSSPMPSSPATPPTPSPRSSHSSLPNRVTSLLTVAPQRPTRPSRPNRQLPAVPPQGVEGTTVTVS